MWTIGKVIHDRGDWLDEAQPIREFFHTLPRQGLQILARDWREKGCTGLSGMSSKKKEPQLSRESGFLLKLRSV